MKSVHFVVFAVLAVLAVVAIRDLNQPVAPTVQFKVDGTRALVFGTTDSRSHQVIKNFVRENPDVRTLVLQSMPGTQDMDTNRRVAMDLRAAGLATHVPSDGRIASGAVDWFIAGTKRTIDCGAMIGVHSWGTDVGDRGDRTLFDGQRGTQRYFLDRMGVSADFYEFTRAAAGPDEIHWLSVEEMLRFGLLSVDPGCEP